MQGIDLGTSVDILMTEGVIATGSVNGIVPCIGVVSGFRVSLVLRVVNGQVERVGACAAVSIVVVVGVVTAGGVGRAVPNEAFAGSL